MADTVKAQDGRKWSVDETGCTSLKVKYKVLRDAVTALGAEPVSIAGIPAIGAVHPLYDDLCVKSYEFEEGESSAKKTVVVTVTYEKKDDEETPEGSEDSFVVEEWGWDAGTEQHELTDGKDGTAVLNSAGDVFDRVPMVSAPAPVFTKVMKYRTLPSVSSYNCKTNSSAITIGDMSCPIGSLLCQACYKRIFGDSNWKYRVTIRLQFKSNPVKLSGSNAFTDVGWDVALTDAGMRELDNTNGGLKLIKQIDAETGKRMTVTSPELLDGHGSAVNRGAGAATPTPYNIRFQAYERTSFPSWFYSDPGMSGSSSSQED